MIQGNIVGLRALEESDLPNLRDWRNEPSFRKNFREHKELNLLNQQNWFSKLNSSSSDFMFGIVDLKSNELIGAAGLLYVNWILRSADFSFYIGRDLAYIDNQGFAEESAALLISYGFNDLNLNKIWMELYEFDSKKLIFFKELFGFKTDGRLRQNSFYNGRYWDSFIISLLRNEYTSKAL